MYFSQFFFDSFFNSSLIVLLILASVTLPKLVNCCFFSPNKFISEEDHSLKGKSGHYHNIDLIATNPNTATIFLYVLKSENEIDQPGINSKIIQSLDCNPTKTIIIGNLSDKAKSLASRYDISVIDSREKNEILSLQFLKVPSDFIL